MQRKNKFFIFFVFLIIILISCVNELIIANFGLYVQIKENVRYKTYLQPYRNVILSIGLNQT